MRKVECQLVIDNIDRPTISYDLDDEYDLLAYQNLKRMVLNAPSPSISLRVTEYGTILKRQIISPLNPMSEEDFKKYCMLPDED